MSRSAARRRTVLGGLGAATLGLGGCAFAGGDRPASNSSAGSTDRLVVWFPGTNQTEIDLVTKTIVPQFEKDHGVRVEVTYLDWGDLSTKLNAAFAAGTAPDVFGHGPAAVADFVVNDRLEDLSPFVAKLPGDDRDDLSAALPGGQVDSRQYLIPLSLQGSLIAYRAADLTAAGLDPDRPPATWEELHDAALRLTARDGDRITRSGLLLASHPIGRQQSFATLLASTGGRQLTDSDPAKASFATAEGETALDYLTALWRGNPAVAADLGEDWTSLPTEQQPLVTGRAAMTMLTATVAQTIATAHPEFDLRVVPPLPLAGGEPGVLGGAGPGLMINKDSVNKDLAWRFITYFIDPATSTTYTQGVGAIPVRRSASTSEYVTGSRIMTAFVDAADAWVPNPNVPGWVQVRDTLSKFLEQALNGQVPAHDALAQAAPAVDDVLAKAARAGGS
ncbi:ABC transporter substrate-binding protein [Kineococcus rhizosphaerae]|uniref:Carbohydrate ABC transporter substrate-binding protein (CUT1 family) n=1 Tax=Kineococcus rhizosphaerae TaxID=559628 RepID=A0A2T0R2C5_9ACTN|nr:ABC transporter substrate-binding protein [Kineococcus rhizosphaerae]PRY13930.1 carbohydrate ABC transporter substrate-binding protein (CUT1 family) [Kineococcus rhizosphaerae]